MLKYLKVLWGRAEKISRSDVSADIRKIGIAGIITGLVQAFLSDDKSFVTGGLPQITTGAIIWITGLYIGREKS